MSFANKGTLLHYFNLINKIIPSDAYLPSGYSVLRALKRAASVGALCAAKAVSTCLEAGAKQTDIEAGYISRHKLN
jgi:hypothetical protein